MTPDLTNQVAAGLLLLTLASVLGIFLLLIFLVVRFVKKNRLSLSDARHRSPNQSSDEFRDGESFRPTAFDPPARWVAVKTSSLAAVQPVLGLHNPTPCSWSDGLSKLGDHTLFISPPIQGWTLILGQGLPDPAENVDQCFHFILKLSRALGQVQFFSANRAVNHHAWVRAQDGQILRAYAWAGETLWNQGKLTHAEIDLGLKCFSYCELASDVAISGVQSHHANAEKLYLLAGRWSLDPTSIAEDMFPERHGISGELSHSRQH